MLQDRLRQYGDAENFAAAVVMAAAERGFRFTGEDVEEAMQANLRAWFERLVVR